MFMPPLPPGIADICAEPVLSLSKHGGPTQPRRILRRWSSPSGITARNCQCIVMTIVPEALTLIVHCIVQRVQHILDACGGLGGM